MLSHAWNAFSRKVESREGIPLSMGWTLVKFYITSVVTMYEALDTMVGELLDYLVKEE